MTFNISDLSHQYLIADTLESTKLKDEDLENDNIYYYPKDNRYNNNGQKVTHCTIFNKVNTVTHLREWPIFRLQIEYITLTRLKFIATFKLTT